MDVSVLSMYMYMYPRVPLRAHAVDYIVCGVVSVVAFPGSSYSYSYNSYIYIFILILLFDNFIGNYIY